MAEKNAIERVYTIPLRSGWLKTPRARRSNKAVRMVRDFVKKHTKSTDVKISKGVNELIFSHGFKKPPAKIKVEVKGDFSKVNVKLPGEVLPEKKEKKTGAVAGLKERLIGGKAGAEKKEELKAKVEEKIKEATSDEKVKEAVEKVKKQEDEEAKKEETK